MFTLQFQLSEEEYFAFNYFTAWGSPDKKHYRLRYYLRVFSMYTAIVAIYLVLRHSERLWIDITVFGIITIIYFLLVPTLIRGAIRRRVRQILAEPENRHILGQAEVILSDDGIVDRDEASETKYSWDAIVKKAEHHNCYYLYTNSHHAIVIPGRAVAPADREALQRLLDHHLPLSAEFEQK